MKRGPLLLTGTSHVGKSTCAGKVGAALGWPVVSTDALARHPGSGKPDPNSSRTGTGNTVGSDSAAARQAGECNRRRPADPGCPADRTASGVRRTRRGSPTRHASLPGADGSPGDHYGHDG